MYYLQNRWKLEKGKLQYYGLRGGAELFHNTLPLSKKQAAVIATLPRQLSEGELHILNPLLGKQIVREDALKQIPKSLSEATFCTDCCANDFIIPGLEFDSRGRCPMCQTADAARELKSLVPLVEEIPRSRHSRFDIALFYTGGKDSTYMLYYLSKVKGLRVLALTWEIPYMSESARQSIANAKRLLTNVEFISRSVSQRDLKTVYRKLYALSGNTCACPSLAYLLFYPELVANRVPYFAAGNEPVQMLGLYYNHMAPKLAYGFATNRFLTFLMNAGSWAERYAKENNYPATIMLTPEQEAEQKRQKEAEARRRRETQERRRREAEEKRKREAEEAEKKRKLEAEVEERIRRAMEELERKRQAELAEKRARYDAIMAAIALQNRIIAENKGWFGAQAKARQAAQQQLLALQEQLTREFPTGRP